MIHTIRVRKDAVDPQGEAILREVKRLGLGPASEIQCVKVYRFEFSEASPHKARKLRAHLGDVEQIALLDERFPAIGESMYRIEVGYKPGVMNPESASLKKMASDLGITLLAVDSSVEYELGGVPSREAAYEIVERLLLNPTVQRVVEGEPKTLIISGAEGPITTIPLRKLGAEALQVLSKERTLSLNLIEMETVQAYFTTLGRDPTDAELEAIAQTWSEHCSHKTFKSPLRVAGEVKAPLLDRLRKTAARYNEDVLSMFEDNSGVIAFYDGYGVCIKVETHNSPSALEPYGGAATGSGGVFRDIMGTGQGAKIVASTDIFCFAPPDLPASELPSGCLPPDYLLTRVVAGVRDYGNRMGVPTCNGSIHFHPDFRAKPTVIVGACGILPADRAQKGRPEPGDLVMALGGKTGRDGIHGATFSSVEMTEKTMAVDAAAVQIGNPIEQKRMADALLELRDQGCIRAITDCGAGGFSSAVGEMGSETGVRVELSKAPLKYTGLAPWEVLLSESQERMVIAVPAHARDEVFRVCRLHGVEATVLGAFTDDHRFHVDWKGVLLCDLDMEFLHGGIPKRELEARGVRSSYPEPSPALLSAIDWVEQYGKVMTHLNVCSKERIVRCYDHSVQGTSALPPYGGVRHDGPNDAAVLRLLSPKPYGIVLAHGLNPLLVRINPYEGTIWAAVEALSNLVAVGGKVREAALVDNFIWPAPDAESLFALDQAVDALCDIMHAFQIPFISGKDSLSSTYRGKGAQGEALIIKIPPVVCVSALGRIPDVHKTASSDFKQAGSSILLVGKEDPGAFGGSVLYDTLGYVGNHVPRVDLSALSQVFDLINLWIGEGAALAVHDVSEGGVAVALAEMCFGGKVGAEIDPCAFGGKFEALFNETPGRFLVEVPPEIRGITGVFPGLVRDIGRVIEEPALVFGKEGAVIDLTVVERAWKRPLEEVLS